VKKTRRKRDEEREYSYEEYLKYFAAEPLQTGHPVADSESEDLGKAIAKEMHERLSELSEATHD
jgi:hypothetical protein